LRAFKTINLLIGCVHDETRKCAVESPAEYTRAWLQKSRARSANTQRVRERHERLWPYVKEMVSANPGEKAATIATRLRRKRGFCDEFKVPRSTLEGDVQALMDATDL
jgi:hypothetical protein